MPTALITGPTAGIGHAFARAYAARGYDLVLVSRDVDRLRRVADELKAAHGVGCQVLPADLGEIGDLARVEDRIADTHSAVDVLVNNAGSGLGRRFGESDIEEEERSLDVLVRAPMRLTHTAVRVMGSRGHGTVVNVSSVAGFAPRGSYGAHKAWLTSLSEWLHYAYRRRGVTVMALCPGFVRTEFHRRADLDVSSVPAWLWLDADAVVAAALRDLAAGKAVSVPTKRYAALSVLARLAPGRVVASLPGSGR
ncbi:MAG: SDR family NAD(P)-dependent oxidoreductase [Actinomycetota bacterium]|nr:SDR family NAD(P)-dependent oxidoreductase [Actinomycetota bacterium]